MFRSGQVIFDYNQQSADFGQVRFGIMHGHVLNRNAVNMDEDKLRAMSETGRICGKVSSAKLLLYRENYCETTWCRDGLRFKRDHSRSWKRWLWQHRSSRITHRGNYYCIAGASSFGISAMLLQIQEDGRRAPGTYVARALSVVERKYSQIEKESLTWECEKFHWYLFGMKNPFLRETDHKSLQTNMNVQNLDECHPEDDIEIDGIQFSSGVCTRKGGGRYVVSSSGGRRRWCDSRHRRQTYLGSNWFVADSIRNA